MAVWLYVWALYSSPLICVLFVEAECYCGSVLYLEIGSSDAFSIVIFFSHFLLRYQMIFFKDCLCLEK